MHLCDGAFSPELIKTDSECGSENLDLGPQSTLAACAAACDRHQYPRQCQFFNYGKLQEAGRCFMEQTTSSRCEEGWLSSETRDFYKLNRLSDQPVMGCMDERASNYNAAATQDDGTWCSQLADPCVSRAADGACANCVTSGQCTNEHDMNDGFRNSANDTVYASKVADGSIKVDGDLRDWATAHSADRHYESVAFASLTGDVVTFESHDGGKWYGPSDFSVSFMLAWDSRHFYLAAEVQDDMLTAGRNCWDTGLQAGFEVSSEYKEASLEMGLLQAERSKDGNISKLQLINLGLRPEQVAPSGTAACSSSLVDPLSCCIHYERSVQDGGFVEKTQIAVLRNPVTRVTTYEVAFALEDLLGSRVEDVYDSHWREGLRFGFSFLVNDGDDKAKQQGWAGYYPHALTMGWNHGNKEPWKVGVVQLARYAEAPASGGGGCGGLFFLGLLLGVGAVIAFLFRRQIIEFVQKRLGRTTSTSAPATPLAAADYMSSGSAPALTVHPPAPASSMV